MVDYDSMMQSGVSYVGETLYIYPTLGGMRNWREWRATDSRYGFGEGRGETPLAAHIDLVQSWARYAMRQLLSNPQELQKMIAECGNENG